VRVGWRHGSHDPRQRIPEWRHVTIGGKTAAATFVHMNTLKVVAPALPPGVQRIVITSRWRSRSVDPAFMLTENLFILSAKQDPL